MKPSRFIILLIAAVMLLGTVGAVSAAPTLVVEVPTEEVAVGETITVPVTVTNSIPIISLQVDVPNTVAGAVITINKTTLPPAFMYGGQINSNAENNVQQLSWANSVELSDTTLKLFDLDIKITGNNILSVPVVVTVNEYYTNDKTNHASEFIIPSASITIARAPPVASFVEIIEPVEDTKLAYGTEGRAVAVVYDQYREVMDAEVTWSVCKSDSIKPATGLSIDAAGNYKVVNCAEEAVQIFAKSGDVSTSNVVKLVKAEPTEAMLTVTPTEPWEFSYDTQEHGVEVAKNASIEGLGDVTVLYNGKETLPVNAGTYTVTASFAEGDNYVGKVIELGTLTITKAEPGLIHLDYPETIEAVTYNGDAHTVLVTANSTVIGLGDITVLYNGTEVPPVDAGTYQVSVSIKEGENFNATVDAIPIGTLTVNKAEPTLALLKVTPTLPVSYEYGQIIEEIQATPAKGVIGLGAITIKYNESTDVPTKKNTYLVNASIDEGKNYLGAELHLGILTITGRQIEQPTITGTYTYTGEVLTADIAESDDYTVTGNKATAAGTHNVTVSLTDKANTAWKNGGTADIELSWVIAKANPTIDDLVSTIPTDVVYGQTYEVTATAKDTVFGLGDITLMYDGTAAVPVNAGTYQVNASIAAGTNYTAAELYLGNLVIAPAVPTLDNIDFTIPYGVVYGQTYEVTAAAKDTVFGLGDITLKYNETPVNAGTYLVNASIATGTNYTAAELYLGNLVINKADPTIENLTFSIPTGVIYGKKYNVTFGVADGVVGLENITLKYNGTAVAPVNAGTYLVNASVEGTNYNATELYLGNLVINKAELTAADFTFTPALPVSYEEGSAEAVVVTVKEGIFGNGTVTVKYGDLTTVPTTEGIYKVNATFAVGVNYTAAEFYLGDMTIVKKVAPEFGDVVTENANGSITVTGGTRDTGKNTTTIVSNGVNLVIAFADMTVSGTAATGNITGITATYPNTDAASPKAGEFAYNLTINLGKKLTMLLPEMSGVYNDTVVSKVSTFLGTKATFDGLVMITGKNVDAVNANLTAGNGNIQIVFKIPKAAVSDKSKLVVYHVGNAVKKATVKSIAEDGTFFLVTVTGSGFSSYVAGIENDVSSGSTSGGSAGILIPSSSKTPTTVTPPEVPVDPETPSDEPGEVPSEIPGTTPSEPGKSPAPILGVLAALGAAVVLRRK